MPKVYTAEEQKRIDETLYAIVVANNTLRQEKQKLIELDPNFAFDYWEASITEREWSNYYHAFVNKEGTDFKQDALIIKDWQTEHIRVTGTSWDNEEHIDFEIPYTWFTDRVSLLTEFQKRDEAEAAKKRQQEIIEKQVRIHQLEKEIKALQDRN